MIFSRRRETQRTFWVTLCIELSEPIPEVDSAVEKEPPEVLIGYFQNFGVTAPSAEAALDVAYRAASVPPTDGILSARETKVHPVDLSTLDNAVRRRMGDCRKRGIWYRNRRAFFGAEDEGSENN